MRGSTKKPERVKVGIIFSDEIRPFIISLIFVDGHGLAEHDVIRFVNAFIKI